ncbi:MAG: NAD-dependent epimerase/dehydratase family protein, partial [Chloroflexota bacterium]
MRTALITGVAGFIGSHIAEALIDQGFCVVGIDNESTGKRENVPNTVNYFLGDVLDNPLLDSIFNDGIDVVFHLSGLASTVLSFVNPNKDIENNVIGTLNIIKLCQKHRVSRVLYASSMTCYGHPTRIPVKETENALPISYYGISKYTAERYLLATAMRNDLNFPFNATCFRMFNVYGERQRLDNPYQG